MKAQTYYNEKKNKWGIYVPGLYPQERKRQPLFNDEKIAADYARYFPRIAKLDGVGIFYDAPRMQWCLDYRIIKEDGKSGRARNRISCDIKKAVKKAEDKYFELQMGARTMTPQDIRDAHIALYMVRRHENRKIQKCTLIDAAKSLIANFKDPHNIHLLEDVAQKFLAHKETGLSPKGYKSLKYKVEKLVRHFPDQDITEMDDTMLIAYFDDLENSSSVSNRNKHVSDIGNFFNHISNEHNKHRLLQSNPMGFVRWHYEQKNKNKRNSDRNKRNTPIVLTVNQIESTIRHAIEFEDSMFLGFTIISIFLGLRPSEIHDLIQIDNYFEKYVGEDNFKVNYIGKKDDVRNVPILSIARKWLDYIKAHQIPVFYPSEQMNAELNRYKKFRRLIFGEQNARKKPYQDVFRHCFGTYYFHLVEESYDNTVKAMGNSIRVFIEHYKGHPLSQDEVYDYWNKFTPEYFGLKMPVTAEQSETSFSPIVIKPQIFKPAILKEKEVKEILLQAVEFEDSMYLGFSVMSFFLGLKPSEIQAIMLQKIDWKSKIVKTGKLYDEFVMDFSPKAKEPVRKITIFSNTKKWLDYLIEKELPIIYPTKTMYNQRLRYKKFRKLTLGTERTAQKQYQNAFRDTHRAFLLSKLKGNLEALIAATGNSADIAHITDYASNIENGGNFWRITPEIVLKTET